MNEKMRSLKPVELEALSMCSYIQNKCKDLGVNLDTKYDKDYRKVAGELTKLYKLRLHMKNLSKVLPKHEVIHNLTGESLGFLYDNDYVEEFMLSTNIDVESQIRHTEWYFGYLLRTLNLI